MRWHVCTPAVSVILTLCAVPLGAASINDPHLNPGFNGFYATHEQGWYWYKDPPVKKPEPEAEEAPAPEPPEAKKEVAKIAPPPAPTPSEPTKAAPAVFSAGWVREMLPRYMDNMWSNPTPENVRAYLLLQRFAMDQSQKVAQVAQQVVVGDVRLDETMRRPTSQAASHAIDDQQNREIKRVMKKLAGQAAILYFFKSTCPYCKEQLAAIEWLKQDFGFSVVGVTLDGAVPAEPITFPVRVDQGQAAQLHVQTVPAIFLMDAAGKTDSISQGLMAMPELISRFAISGVRSGWLTKADFDDTQSLPDGGRGVPNLSDHVMQQNTGPAPQMNFAAAANLPQDASGFVAPKDLIAFFGDQLLSPTSTGGALSGLLPGLSPTASTSGLSFHSPLAGVLP